MTTLRGVFRLAVAGTTVGVAAAAMAATLDRLALLDETGAWPSDPRELALTAAILLVLVAGIGSLLRTGFSGLRTAARPPSEQELSRLMAEARTDSLTELANRRAFNDDIATEIARRNRSGAAFSLMAVDLDGLKEINDTYGHPAGDAHLRSIGSRLAAEVGTRGKVYRTGGDEFMVLLPGSRNWDAIELAHRIQGATTPPGGSRVLSIGVTETTGLEHRQELVRQADFALYEAKRGNLPVVPYRPGLESSAADAADSPSPRRKALVAALAHAVSVRDNATGEHSEVVSELAVAVARHAGMSGRRLERLRTAALLHDVGKIAIADAILHKRARLTNEERRALREHVIVGRDLLETAGFQQEAHWVLHHHERFDGAGYPDGLRGREIPLESRIIAVADAFEAMTARRPYRESLTAEEALAELSERAEAQFDTACVKALAAIVRGSSETPPQPLGATV